MESEQNLNKNFLEKFSWHIKETPSTEITEKSPIEKNNFRVEGHTPTEIFIRELGQNALDAKLESKEGPVEIVIQEVEIEQGKRNLYQKVFSTKLKRLLEDSGDIKKKDPKDPEDKGYTPKFKALVISDYGTKGLESNENRRMSDWYKYWHVVGSQNLASKQNQLGSANQGKIAIWSFSSLSTVLGITKLRGGMTRAQGKCIMSTFSDNPANDLVRDCHSFFRKNKNEDNTISYDLEPHEIDQFNNLFDINPRGKFEYGTDFVLIESEDLNEELLLVQTIRNWAIPIAENKIKFNILNKILDKDNIYSLLDEYSDSLSGLSTDFIKFCIEARKKQNNHKIYKLKRDLNYESFKGAMLNDALFEDEVSSKEILKEFNNFEIIEIQFQPKIVYKDKPNSSDRFSTYLMKINREESDAKSLGLLMRSYQILWKEQNRVNKPAQSRDDLFLLTSADSYHINPLLTLFEEPTHLKFNGEQIDFKHKDVPYAEKPTKNLLSLFRRAAGLSAYYLNESDIEQDPDYFGDWFNDDSEKSQKGDKKDNPRKKIIKKKIVPPGPPKFPAAIDMEQEKGEIIIKSQKNYTFKEGDLINIKLAANLPSGCGNAFSEYTIFDFNLREMEVTHEEGCTIAYAELNELQIAPFQDEFRIKIDGFWDQWGYVMNSKIVNKN